MTNTFTKGGVLKLRQPYVRPTGLLKETPHAFCAASSRANKGVTMSAPRNKYRLQIGLSGLRSGLSVGSSSASAKHKATSKSSSLSLLAETHLKIFMLDLKKSC